MRELIKIFKALSDETRIRLLKLLQHRELCVCELMETLDMTQSRISRNLGILEDAGLVKHKRDGPRMRHSLNENSHSGYAEPILALLSGWINDDEIVLKDLEQMRESLKSTGGK